MIRVAHRFGSYAVEFVGFAGLRAMLPERTAVLTDENVLAAWGREFGPNWQVLSLPPGEPTKCLASLGRVWDWLAEIGTDRTGSLALIGGGVIGDLGGFAAASYMRGIAYVQIPTSLMAQVDSSVGGKVGIDLSAGKNLAGAFWPPSRVLVSTETLRTLPEREFRSGVAEVLKYGFVADLGLLEQLERGTLVADSDQLESVVARCIDVKRRAVEADELDVSGVRATLNFGHTVGHALEKLAGYGALLHGEAVAIGMAVEARLGEQLGISESGTFEFVRTRLDQAGLPTAHDLLSDSSAVIRAMRLDKKATDGKLAMSLLVKPGECRLVPDVPEASAVRALLPS